ncbi:DUF2884 family protein [Alteromonadaceae bacterium M269]|nr:DUF2884 family protein [Alteromonadaceae bacterium M269]
MRTLLLSACLAASTTVAANECDIHIQGQIGIDKENVIIETEDDDYIRFTESELWVNRQSIDLDSHQRALVGDYFNGIQESAPLTFDIAMDAIDLAGVGVTTAFGEILGEDDGLIDELNESFATFKDKMEQRFYDGEGRMHFNSTSFGGENFLGDDFDDELGEEIESLVSRSVGRLMIAIGTEMLFGDGDTSDFEQRMEAFGEDLEQQLELKAEHIEEKADVLCDVLIAVDSSESKLQRSIPELKNLDVLNVDKEYRM